jgi:hypothetical protein
MASGLRHRRAPYAVAALLMTLTSAGCGTPPALENLRDGPAARWSVPFVGGGQQRVVVIGDAVVIPDAKTVRAVSRATGAVLWQRQLPTDYRITVAGDLILVQESKEGPLEVLEAATGATAWRATPAPFELVIYRAAVYFFSCRQDGSKEASGKDTGRDCSITARDIRSGTPLWTVPTGTYTVSDDAIGVRRPYAPTAGRYLVAGVGNGAQPYALIDPATGRALAGRAQLDGWYQLAVGTLLVDVNNDPPAGDRRCTVRVAAYDGATGARAWTTEVFSGRATNDECQRTLAPYRTEQTLIGAGSRIAASTDGRQPQVVDLATGATVWTASTTGVPIDGDDHFMLIRDRADAGPLALLDFGSGARRWSAPDPGLSGQSASWATAVTGRLVAVSGAKGERPFVLVYAAADGRRLGRFPSWLAGAGEDWVAVSHTTGVDRGVLEFVELPVS